MSIQISVVTDEISPSLDAALEFAAEQGLKLVDLRSIGGRNILSLDPPTLKGIADDVRAAGLKVGCIATPLLKWPRPGTSAGHAGDQFGFDPRGRRPSEIYADAVRCAQLLGTRHLRIFSFLTYDGFKLQDLDAEYEALLRLAEANDLVLHVENEPVCPIATISDLNALMAHWRHPRLRALLDIGNSYSAGQPADVAAIATLMPFVDQLHLKDSLAARPGQRRRTMPVGEGEIPYPTLLVPCLAAARDRDITWTVETHVPENPQEATRRSLTGVRRLLPKT